MNNGTEISIKGGISTFFLKSEAIVLQYFSAPVPCIHFICNTKGFKEEKIKLNESGKEEERETQGF